MKLYSLLIFQLLMASICQLQAQECVIRKSIDEFTGKASIKTDEVMIIDVFPLIGSKEPWNLDMYFYFAEDKLSLRLRHESQGVASLVYRISYKFSDGSVIIKEKPTEGIDHRSGGYTFKGSFFDLTKEELKKFTEQSVTKIRVEFSYFDEDPIVEKIPRKVKTDRLKLDAECILKELK